MEPLTITLIGLFALSVLVLGYLIHRAGKPEEPRPDPMSQILEAAAVCSTVEGNEAMAAAVRSLNQLYLLGFEHLASGALAREVAFARAAMKDLGVGERLRICRQDHYHKSAALAQACDAQAAEDRSWSRSLHPGNR